MGNCPIIIIVLKGGGVRNVARSMPLIIFVTLCLRYNNVTCQEEVGVGEMLVTIEGGYTTLMSSLKVPKCVIFEILNSSYTEKCKMANMYQLQSSK